MNLAVRPASLLEERKELLALLDRNLPTFNMGAHFGWRHEGNPAGPGWCWVLYNRNSGALGGMTSVFPRPMYAGGRLLLCGQVGEFVVDSTYRSLGPAVMLQRATFEPVNSGDLAFCYDSPPHDKGMATFVRLDMSPNCMIVRYALLLQSDEFLRRRLGPGAWTRPVVAGTNFVLRMRRSGRSLPGVEICPFEGPFGEEFSVLDQSVSTAGVIRARRSAADLNWRYMLNPLRTNLLPSGNVGGLRTLVARKGGQLVAFVIFYMQTNRRAVVVDAFGQNLSSVWDALLESVINLCRRESMYCLYANSAEGSELSGLLRRSGFRRRERAARLVAYEKSNGHAASLLNSGLRWAFTEAECSL